MSGAGIPGFCHENNNAFINMSNKDGIFTIKKYVVNIIRV
jgi:hypothetical protein